MKQRQFLIVAILLIAVSALMALKPINDSKTNEIKPLKKTIKIKKSSCNCDAAVGLYADSPSGGYVTLHWTAVTGAIGYTYGGFYSNGNCGSSGAFSGCVYSNSVTIPYCSSGTWRVTTICEGDCSNIICASSSSSQAYF